MNKLLLLIAITIAFTAFSQDSVVWIIPPGPAFDSVVKASGVNLIVPNQVMASSVPSGNIELAKEEIRIYKNGQQHRIILSVIGTLVATIFLIWSWSKYKIVRDFFLSVLCFLPLAVVLCSLFINTRLLNSIGLVFLASFGLFYIVKELFYKPK